MMQMTPCTLFTCAVSSQLTHYLSSLEALKQLLRRHEFKIVIDIRPAKSLSNSKEFGESDIRRMIESIDIQYHWAGKHFANNFLPTEQGPDTALPAQLRGFAMHMRGDQFAIASKQLMRLCASNKTLMLSDTTNIHWCTRRLIADYFELQGQHVFHLNETQFYREHQISDELRRESAELIYDRTIDVKQH